MIIKYLIIFLLIFINFYLLNFKYKLDDNIVTNLLFLYLIIIVYSINKIYSLLLSFIYIICKFNYYSDEMNENFENNNQEENNYDDYNDEENYESIDINDSNEDITNYNDNDNYIETLSEVSNEPENTTTPSIKNEEIIDQDEIYEESEYEEITNKSITKKDPFQNTYMESICNSITILECMKKKSLDTCLNDFCKNNSNLETETENETEIDKGTF